MLHVLLVISSTITTILPGTLGSLHYAQPNPVLERKKLILNHGIDRAVDSYSNLQETCHCGIKNNYTLLDLERITGGTLSKPHAWPWMAAIVHMGGREPFWFCGASLINDKYLLTAAHCLNTINRYGISNVRIFLGTNEIITGTNRVNVEINSLLKHPKYNSATEDFDIALIKLKKKVVFSNEVSPICLTQRGTPFTGRTATVAGWGSTSYGRAPPEALRDVNVKVVTNPSCSRTYFRNYRTPITSSMLCAWNYGKDSCQGDSGGPIFLKTKSEPFVYTQIGIVSFGPPDCGSTNIPGVYSRISSSIKWIKEHTKDAKYCM